ncbi:MAG: hypothetical protein ACI8RD_014639, partial [Bacillariaceae sp.]
MLSFINHVSSHYSKQIQKLLTMADKQQHPDD